MMKNLSKRLAALTFAVLLICASALTAFAAPEGVLNDDAQVFTAAETTDLQSRLNTAGEQTGWQIIVCTSVGNLKGESLENHFRSLHQRYGWSSNAIVFVIEKSSETAENNNGTRKIISFGDVKKYFDKTKRYDEMIDKMSPYIDSNNMYAAAVTFIDQAVAVHNMGQPNILLESLKRFGIIIGIVAVAAGVVLFFVIKSKYKNMGKSGTYDLASNSSVNLDDVEDTFVNQYTTVRTIKSDSDNSSGGSSGGGSSRDF